MQAAWVRRTSEFGRAFRATFIPLRSSNFRRYLSGQAISLIGTWLQLTAQGWVVWELSHSPAALGVVGMLGTLPILLVGPWAGVWADRLDRRRLLIVTQAVAMLLAFCLALLTQLHIVQLWHVYVLAGILGIVSALDMPTQQAFIGDLAGVADVRKGVVLNTMIIQISRTVGPAVAGFIIGAYGAATAFWLNGASFLVVIGSLMLVRSSQVRQVGRVDPLREFWEGLRYIGSQPRLLDLILLMAVITFLGIPVLNLLPSVATDVLHGQAQTLGWLLAASGLGALTGTLLVVPAAQAQPRIGLVVGVMAAWMGAWIFGLSLSRWLPLSLLCMFLLSMGGPVVFTTANGLLQMLGPANMRARLLSAYVMVSFGLQPIAALLVGFSAERLGTPTAIAINGLLLVLAAGLIVLLRPELRSWNIASIGPAMPETVEPAL
ncbi:MAG: MFS transporter [Anaerolineales bacterium]